MTSADTRPFCKSLSHVEWAWVFTYSIFNISTLYSISVLQILLEPLRPPVIRASFCPAPGYLAKSLTEFPPPLYFRQDIITKSVIDPVSIFKTFGSFQGFRAFPKRLQQTVWRRRACVFIRIHFSFWSVILTVIFRRHLALSSFALPAFPRLTQKAIKAALGIDPRPFISCFYLYGGFICSAYVL